MATQQSLAAVEVKIFLLRRGLSQPQAAKQLGITRQYFYHVVNGQRRALQIRRRMVEELGIPAALVAWRKSKAA